MNIKIERESEIFLIKEVGDIGLCGVCKEKLSQPCIECKTYKIHNCLVITGKCGHKYHQHCTEAWNLEHDHCQTCAAKWEV
jgi:anaphase-promoting complex subunit 11